MPSLLGDGDKGIDIVYGKEKIFCTGPARAAKAEKNILQLHDKPIEPTKEGPLSFVLFESPFISVSTVSRGRPSLVSLIKTYLVIVEGEQGRVSRVRWRWQIIEKGAEGPSGNRRYRA